MRRSDLLTVLLLSMVLGPGLAFAQGPPPHANRGAAASGAPKSPGPPPGHGMAPAPKPKLVHVPPRGPVRPPVGVPPVTGVPPGLAHSHGLARGIKLPLPALKATVGVSAAATSAVPDAVSAAPAPDGVAPDGVAAGADPAQTGMAQRPGAPSASMAGVPVRDMVANQVIVAVPATQEAGALAGDYGLSSADEFTIGSLGIRLISFTIVRPRGLGDVIDQMGLDARVQAVQPNFRYRTAGSLAEYPHLRTRLESARALASGAGVRVALVDTRVADLPSLKGHVVERVSLVAGAGPGRHGTAIAGLIADVAPAASLLAIEAFEDTPGGPDSGTATTLTLARALDAAMERRTDVLNLSVAGPRDPLIGRMIRQAIARGTVIVAAAGNEGPGSPPRYPAAYDGVVAVTAVDHRDQLYPAAVSGSHVALAAPGVDVAVEAPGGGVAYASGTSIAAAQVAGVAALLRERVPALSSTEAKRIFAETAIPLPDGPGLMDAFAAVSRVTALAQR